MGKLEYGAQREEMALAGRRLAEAGLVVGSEGNISLRLPDGALLVSGSGSELGALPPARIALLRTGGKLDPGSTRPTSELAAHLACYASRSDIGSVVHAHPPHCIALMLRGEGLAGLPLPEAAYSLGNVPTTRFALPGTDEGGEVVAESIGEAQALLLDRHGALAVGSSMDEAVARMELLEKLARITLLAGGAAQLRPLPRSELPRIADVARRAGVLDAALNRWLELVPTR